MKTLFQTINKTLKKDIDGNTRSTKIKFNLNENFPYECLNEIKRLYKKAGWTVSMTNKYKDRYNGYEYNFENNGWEITFKLPDHVNIPEQYTKVRVDAVTNQNNEELDPLEAKFAELERNQK